MFYRKGLIHQAQQTSIRVYEESESVAIHKKEYEEDRAELEKLRYELEAEKAHVRADHLKLEQKRTEILMRERMIDQLKLTKVQEDLEFQQRSGVQEHPLYTSDYFARKDENEYIRRSGNENLSPNKSNFATNIPQTESKVESIYEKVNVKVAEKEETKEERKDNHSKYHQLSQRVADIRNDDPKSAFDFNNYDEDDDDDDDDEDEEN